MEYQRKRRLIYILIAVVWLWCISLSDPGLQAQAARPSSGVHTENTKPVVIAYYFHGKYRCYTCKKIEQYSREAIERYYADEIGAKKLEFRPVNIDEKGNSHFVQDYQLYTRSLVISLQKNNRELKWINLKEVWSYVGDQKKFHAYVKHEIGAMLKEAK